ncbi:MAG: hypothetical protein FD180_1664 [Planctomycetota bacterium]|nr:MAG: hypothetical protein FD180_1664 [Planctomycetota bacterium]
MQEMRKITRLQIGEGLSIRLTFDDGSTRAFDLAPLLKKGGVYSPLARTDYFKSARVAPDGRYVEWPDGLDLCADALWIEGVPTHESA